MQPIVATHIPQEQIHATHDWKSFFAPLEMHYKGLFGMGGGTADAAHCVRVVRIDDLATHHPALKVESPYAGFNGLQRSGSDAVLVCKHLLSSQSLSQVPTLLLPSTLLKCLDWLADIPVAPRNPLVPEGVKQFRRTANSISAAPWSLTVASEFLLDWVERNQAGTAGTPPVLHVVLAPRPVQQPDSSTASWWWEDFTPRAAVPVAAQKAKGLRAKAKANATAKAEAKATAAAADAAHTRQAKPSPEPEHSPAYGGTLPSGTEGAAVELPDDVPGEDPTTWTAEQVDMGSLL